MGRPSDYTPEIAAKICEQLIEGASLRTICAAEDMPDKATVLRWLANPEFRDQYARARELQADLLFEEILLIADDASGDLKQKDVGDAVVEVVDHEHISRSKLRVDTRKWVAGKLAPKKYGDRVAVTGADGGAFKHEDMTPRQTSDQVTNDLIGIFGAAAAAIGAAPAKPAPVDRAVRAGADGRSRKKPRASKAGKKVVRS